MYVEERGSKTKPAIVFIHGGGVAGWMWRQQLEHFADYYCLVPDLPEHGRSIDLEPLELRDCAQCIADLITAKVPSGKAHVVGHSLGGKVVVELLALRPEVVDRAVAASALFGLPALLNLFHKPWIYRLATAMLKRDALLALTAKQLKFPDEFYLENGLNALRRLSPETMFRIFDQLVQYQSIPQGLAKVDVPLLAVAGEKELKQMKQSVTALTNALPNSQGVIIQRADHTYPWSMAETFNRVVRMWLNTYNVCPT